MSAWRVFGIALFAAVAIDQGLRLRRNSRPEVFIRAPELSGVNVYGLVAALGMLAWQVVMAALGK